MVANMHKGLLSQDDATINLNHLICVTESLKPKGLGNVEPVMHQILSYLTYASELVTVLYTIVYIVIQEIDATGPNGFCIPLTDTHLTCGVFDAFVLGAAWGRCFEMNPVPYSWSDCYRQASILLGSSLHAYGHISLYYLTQHMSVDQISHYRHWSFALVLLLINMGYCLPRLVLYMPSDVKDRCKPMALSASLGILLLMVVAWLERFYCEHIMAPIGGHLIYDTVMAFVVLATI